MLFLSDIMFALSAVLHGWFLLLEMFLWEKPIGLKVFRQSREQAATTSVLAKNQGLYNGFLAAGIAWGLAESHSAYGMRVRLFFGACVVVAGVFGSISTGKRAILVVQALPALIAVAALGLAPRYEGILGTSALPPTYLRHLVDLVAAFLFILNQETSLPWM
jgi:putative membrane protein